MGFEQTLIKWLQRFSVGFTDGLNLCFTLLGDEMFFIAVAVVLYWCIDKRFAYKFMNVYLFSVAVNEGLKTIVKRARPYTKEGIRSIGKETGGYSFPSGHSQSIANISVQINARYYPEKKLRRIFLPLGIVLSLLVAFSRMFLGQHYLSDVIVGLALGGALAVLFGYLFDLLGDKEEWIMIVAAPLCLIAAVVLAALQVGGVSEVMTVLGAYTAITAGYFAEKKFIGYNVKSDAWWKYLLKAALGLASTFALKELLKLCFDPEQYLLYNYLRYFIVGLWASLACPVIFKYCKL